MEATETFQGSKDLGMSELGPVPQHGRFVFKTGNNFNKGARQESGNVDFGVNAEGSHQGQISNSILNKATETCERSNLNMASLFSKPVNSSIKVYVKCLAMLILALMLITVLIEMSRLIHKMKVDSFGLSSSS